MTWFYLCFEKISLVQWESRWDVARIQVGKLLRRFFKIIWMGNDVDWRRESWVVKLTGLGTELNVR